MNPSLTLYAWSTPNGQKPLIMLEELGVDYRLVGVDIGRGHHLVSDYLDINPIGKIPTLVDSYGKDTITVAESAAILVYLAEREGRFLPLSGQARVDTLQWLMFQASTVGPMFAQADHFRKAAPEPVSYAIERYMNEAQRAYQAVDRRLTDHEFIAGDYTIADMALYPWLNSPAWYGLRLADYPHVARWCRTVGLRKAVQSAVGTSFLSADWERSSIAV